MTRHPRSVRSGIVYPWMGGFTPDGRYIDFGVDLEQAGFDEHRRPILTGDGRVTVFALDPASGQVETLPPIPFPADITDDGQLKQSFRSFVGIQDGAGDLWFALTDPYQVHRRTLDGDTLLSFSRPSNPEPISTAAMDSIIAGRAALGFPGPGLERGDFASHYQLVTNVLVDGSGHVFVLPREEGTPAGSVVDVFTDAGTYLGRMSFPEPVVVDEPSPHITDGHVYAVVENDLGIPFVVRFRIEKP